MRSMRLTVLSLGLAALLAGCGAASAGSSGGGAGGSAQAEGIAVHGRWHIAVRNPDGTLDREYVFDNALISAGADRLGQLLARTYSLSRWLVAFGAEDDASPGVGPCSLPLGAMTWTVDGRNPDLTTACVLGSSVPGVAGPSGEIEWTAIPGGIRLTGTAEATQGGTVDFVETWLVLGDDAGAQFAAAFTGTSVGPFEDIAAGQSIQVTVEITFSSPA